MFFRANSRCNLFLCILTLLQGGVGIVHAGAVANGLGTTVITGAKGFTVGGGTLKGNNLFHSFKSFSVSSGNTATFTGPSTVQNVISRVTGGTASTINGTIDTATNMSSANFFLINPAGVVFGSGATLNIGGAFHASTADYLLFGATGEKFYADPAKTSVLSTAAPTAFGFLNAPTGTVKVSGTTLDNKGKTVSLSGAGVTVDSSSTLKSAGGTIDLVAVKSAGTFDFSTAKPTTSSFTAMGDVTVSGSSLVDTSSAAPGTIYIRGGKFVVDNATLKANTTGAGTGKGGIDIAATTSTRLDNSGTVAIQSEANASGNAGSLTIDTPYLTLANSSKITTTSFGAGNGGSATIKVSELVDLNNSSVFLQAQGAGNAASLTMTAKNIRLSSGATVSSSTSSTGTGGNVTMTASEAVLIEGETGSGSSTRASSLFLQSKSGASGNAGTLTLNAKDIALRDGGTISTTTASTGKGGNVTITASNSLELSGSGAVSGKASRLYTATANSVTNGGNGGTLTVKSGTITMKNGGAIVSEATGTGNAGSVTITATGAVTMDGTNGAGQASGISAASKADTKVLTGTAKTAGNAGNISLTAPSLKMTNGAFISGSSVAATGLSSGNAGTITLTISGQTTIDGVNPFGENSDGFGSGLYVRSLLNGGSAAGNAGNVTLNSGGLTLSNGGVINSSTDNAANGGNITIDGGDLSISGSGAASFGAAASQKAFGSGASSSTSGLFAKSSGDGRGGDITLRNLGTLTLSSGGTISSASTSSGANAGNAGAISVSANNSILMRSSARITTESVNGGGGAMTVNAIDRLDMRDSRITTSVKGGLGNGGDINIDPRFVIMNRSTIQANAFGGNGGNIKIVAGNFLKSTGSVVQASSQLGIDGNIQIDSPEIEVDAGLIHLPASFLDASRWVRSACRAQAAGSRSSFIVSQRDGAPMLLGEWLPGDYALPNSGASTAGAPPVTPLAFASLSPLCTR